MIVSVLLAACNTDVAKSFEPRSNALGKMNEIVIIADQDVWDGMAGDSFSYYFESAYPILPAPEPLFDLRHFTVEELEESPLRKELRSYAILADLSDNESPTTQMLINDMGDVKYQQARTGEINNILGKNKWARGQVLIYLFGQDEQKLASAISDNFSAVARRINSHDFNQLKSSIYVKGVQKGISARLQQNFDINLDIPVDYKVAKEEENLLWLRKDTDKATVNLVFKEVPYTSKDQLTKENLMAMRNAFGKAEVSTDTPGSFMVINDEDLPVYDYVQRIDDKYALEIRGVWETTKDFFGGPFITYLILNESTNTLLYVDAFVYAPGSEKRNLMMQLDLLAKSIDFIEGS